MAESAPPMSVPVQSRKQHRAAKRKEKRKRKRQAVAQANECGLKNGGSSTPEEELCDGDEENDLAEEESLRLHEEWMERERIAQEEFMLKFEKEEAARKRKEEEERLIKEEWEAQQKREQEEKEQKQQEKRDKEKEPSYSLSNHYRTFSRHSKDEAVQKMLDEAETQLEESRPWMNPEAPVTEKTENFGTERDVANCPFFLKTGACRFGDRCSRKHVYPTASPTLMIRGMFTTFGLEESCRDDYDIDAYLEHSEEDLHESFLEFYQDVLPEFRSVGKVIQFKVSCNHEPHLRGNVYVQFDTEEQCKDAFIRFNGRWYAGRQLHCEICPVTRWKNAICGLFDRRTCPKGKHCNFLHVFRNPDNEFRDADRDLHLSPDRSAWGSRRDGALSERYGDRSWRQRHSSRSPPGSERSHSRREDDRRRSRSRERRGSLWEREERWSSRSRHSDRRKERYPCSRDRVRSRSRDRVRSRSRDRVRSRSRDRVRSRSRDRVRSRSRDREQRHRSRDKDRESKCRDGRDKDEVPRRESRKRSRSTSTERENRREKSKELSPKIPEKSSKHSRHKRSKKNKKKSKKKHKKKNHLSEASASSGESDKESQEETETCPAKSPSGQTNETELIAKNGDVDLNVDTDSVPSEQPITEILTSLPDTAT